MQKSVTRDQWPSSMASWELEAREEHDEEAASTLYWYLEQGEEGGWYRYHSEKESMAGFKNSSGSWSSSIPTPSSPISKWRPWNKTLETAEAPYFQWFLGGRTNACFNAVDKHLLEGRGADIAFTSCPENQGASISITRRALAVAVAEAAEHLAKEFGLEMRSRVMFHMPTGISQMVYILAAMRLGVVYICTTVDQPAAALQYRVESFKPDAIITQSGTAINAGKRVDSRSNIEQVVDGSCRIVVVDDVRMTESSTKSDLELAAQVWQRAPCAALAADHPLFVSYTSGSTGKPKGVVHTHGGYVYGVTRTMKTVFDADPRKDTILTVGTTAWITGQSYMLVAPLVSGVRSVLMEGSPVFPNLLRFADVRGKRMSRSSSWAQH